MGWAMKGFFSSQHPGGKVSLGSLSQRVVQGQRGSIQRWRPQHVVGGLTNGVSHEADAPSSVVYQAVQQKVTGSKVG